MGKLFVTLFAFNTAYNTAFNTLINPDPSRSLSRKAGLRAGTLICTQYKSCTVTDFWLRDNLYRDSRLRRDTTASVPTIKIPYRDSFPAPIKLVPPTCGTGHGATRVMLNKTCTMTAKSAPPTFGAGHGIPSLSDWRQPGRLAPPLLTVFARGAA